MVAHYLYIKGPYYKFKKFIINLKNIPLAESLVVLKEIINHPS